MNRIIIQNKIKIGTQEELICEEYEGKTEQKASQFCLIYKNSENEKVLIKFDEQALTMIRYSDSPVKLYFRQKNATTVFYEGIGELLIHTQKFEVDWQAATLELHYQISQNHHEIGDYYLKVNWIEIL